MPSLGALHRVGAPLNTSTSVDQGNTGVKCAGRDRRTVPQILSSGAVRPVRMALSCQRRRPGSSTAPHRAPRSTPIQAGWWSPDATTTRVRRSRMPRPLAAPSSSTSTRSSTIRTAATTTLLNNASECGPATSRWPGNFQANSWGYLNDFRVGSVLQSKFKCVLEKMVAENPHMGGWFADDLGSRSWFPGLSWAN